MLYLQWVIDEGFDNADLLGNVGLYMAACRRHEITEPSRKTSHLSLKPLHWQCTSVHLLVLPRVLQRRI